ncbi:hypothetical protein O5541_05590 [Escherichia coli]|nr:hypothetical protein [Escherichia coli]
MKSAQTGDANATSGSDEQRRGPCTDGANACPGDAAPSRCSGWDNVPAPAEPTYRSNVNVKHG